MPGFQRVGIAGIGRELPKEVMTNEDIAGWWLGEVQGGEPPEAVRMGSIEAIVYDSHLQWPEKIERISAAVVQRTGIRERRVASPEQSVASMATEAAKRAMAHAGIDPKEIEAVLLGTCTGSRMTEGTKVQDALGLSAECLDVNAACASGIAVLRDAVMRVRGGARAVLAGGSERMWDVLDRRFSGRGENIIFGDGAAMAVLSPQGQHEILAVTARSYGCYHDLFHMEMVHDAVNQYGETGPREVMRMQGAAVMKHAIGAMVESSCAVFQELHRTREDLSHLTLADVDWILPHQANIRIIEGAVKRLRQDHGFRGQVRTNIDRVGNTSSPSPLILLSEMVEELGHRVAGKLLLLIGMGAGMNAGAALVRMGRSSDRIEVPEATPPWSFGKAFRRFGQSCRELVPPALRFWREHS